jgi:hypothetical protein
MVYLQDDRLQRTDDGWANRINLSSVLCRPFHTLRRRSLGLLSSVITARSSERSSAARTRRLAKSNAVTMVAGRGASPELLMHASDGVA